MGAPHQSGAYFKLNNMQQATIDMTGLPDALALDLKSQMEAMVEKARADLPISFQDRVDRALYELPEELGEITDSQALASSMKAELQAHFDKLGFIERVSTQANNCYNAVDEEFDSLEFEHQLANILAQFFV